MTSTKVADRYVLDREIGRGGSGAVWLARDGVLGRVVAMKRVGLPAGASSFDLARAEREARLAARVNHPHVIAVYDFLADGDDHWLVMEHVDGTTLARMIADRGPLPPDEVAPMLAQTAEALAAAHELGIVHRDVKPSNILVGADGEVKLSDFGIARAVADVSLTQTGLVTGSPAYLSPEVATGSGGTTASDVWSFGATMFHALAGRPPYQVEGGGSAVLGVLYRIAHEPAPRLRTAGWLGPLLEMTMTHDPAQRPTMEDVASYLRARIDGGSASLPDATAVLPAVDPGAVGPEPVGPEPVGTTTASLPPTPRPAHPPTGAGPVYPPPPPPPAEQPRRTGTLRAALLGAAVVALLAALGGYLLVGGGDEDPDPAAGRDQRSAPADPADDDPDGSASSPAEPTDSTTDAEAPTAEELEEFAATYVATADSDPDAGFAMLTADYQAQSTSYADFWGPMSNPRILNIKADPEAMTVTYTYQYDFPSRGNVTERVTLQLVRDGDDLRIAGQAG